MIEHNSKFRFTLLHQKEEEVLIKYPTFDRIDFGRVFIHFELSRNETQTFSGLGLSKDFRIFDSLLLCRI